MTGVLPARVADHDAAEPGAQIGQTTVAKREDRHHLAGGGDVEAGLARYAVARPPNPVAMSRRSRS